MIQKAQTFAMTVLLVAVYCSLALGYVLEGSEDYVLEGEPSRTVHAGDVLYEAPMQLHTVDNSEPVKLLVIRVIEKGKEVTVRP